MSLLERSATELVHQLHRGELTSRQVTAAYVEQIVRHDARVGAFLRFDPEAALAEADAVDERLVRKRRAGEPLGRLAGLPVAVKDLLCSAGERVSCASKMLEQFVSPYDATAIARLKAADAVLLGRTNLDEFAMGGSTENSAYQLTRNPWNLDHTPGGSSGGAAACVAASMAPLSLGTDTGGSIRQPAAFCGITGLKPTYGRVSRFGLVAFASSLDQIGPMAHSAADAALLLSVIAGHDLRDATSATAAVPDYLALLQNGAGLAAAAGGGAGDAKPLAGLRIGIPREYFGEGLDREVDLAVREAIAVYESLGAVTREITLPHTRFAVATYYLIAPSEASSNLARYDGAHYGFRSAGESATGSPATGNSADESPLDAMYSRSRAEGFGAEVKRRIMLGAYALSAGYYDAYYLKALKVRRLIRDDFTRAFSEVDLIAGPVTPSPAFRLGEKSADPLAMYLVDIYTVAANLAGIAAIALPCGVSAAGLPIGLQLQAPPFAEDKLLHWAHQFQQVTPWHTRRATL